MLVFAHKVYEIIISLGGFSGSIDPLADLMVYPFIPPPWNCSLLVRRAHCRLPAPLGSATG